MVSILILIPVFLVILAAFTNYLQLIWVRSSLNHQCREKMVELQENARRGLNALTAMNKTAKMLQMARDEAEIEFIATLPEPPLNAIALAKLNTVKATQHVFHGSQIAVLTTTNAKILIDRFQAQRALQSNLKDKLQSETTAFVFPKGKGQLAVKPIPANSDSPEYVPVDDFEQNQSVGFEWKAPFRSLITTWLQPLISDQSMLFKGTCTMSLKREGEKWEIVPFEAKHLLKR